MARRANISCAELAALYQAGQSTTRLAVRYGCSPTTIANRLRRCGVPVRRARFQSADVPEEALRAQYSDARLPIADIAANFGVSVSTIGNKRRLYGIPTRNRTL